MPTKNPLSNEKSAANTPEPRHGTHFVGKMFSGFGHESEFRPSPPQPTAEEPYRALHNRQRRRVQAIGCQAHPRHRECTHSRLPQK